MKKRLLKTMPHVPLLQLRPQLGEQDEALNDPDETAQGNADDDDDTNGPEIEANTTFHDLDTESTHAKYGVVERVKRFISKIKVNSRKIAVSRIRLVTAENDNMPYGGNESSESDNELDLQDGIPLVRRNIPS